MKLHHVVAATAALIAVGTGALLVGQPKPSPAPLVSAPVWIVATASDPALMPIQDLTPGDFDATLTAKDVCSPAYAQNARAGDATVGTIDEGMKKAVLASYEARGRVYIGHKVEIDHREPLTLGGRNTIKNLWAQLYDGPLNAHEKDKLELCDHDDVCQALKADPTGAKANALLHQFQQEFLGDWTVGYKRAFGVMPQ